MKQFTILLLSLFVIIQFTNAQEISQTVKKGFIIISAGKNYKAIKKSAEQAALKLNYKLDFRGLSENSKTGLTISEADCEESGGIDYPYYYARGRYDDGNYVSVEYTDGYKNFSPGYYIIVVSSHEKGSADLKKSLEFVKTKYKDAYIKYTDVYMGCLH